MKPFELTGKTPDGQDGHVWCCGVCLCAAIDRAAAEQCCTCLYCGKEVGIERGYRPSRHGECHRAHLDLQERERMDQAVEDREYHGPFLLGDQYHADMGEVVDYLEGHHDSVDDWPEFIYACKETKPCLVLDLDDLQHKIEDLWEDCDWGDFQGVDELKAALDAFNAANAERATYHEDHRRKVRVPRPKEGGGESE